MRLISKMQAATLVAAVVVASVAAWVVTRGRSEDLHTERVLAADDHSDDEVTIPAPARASIEIAPVERRAITTSLRVPGTVEVDAERTEHATPLVGGRVERVFVEQGDRVGAGAPLAVISSPSIAQMHGKLHEAETRVALAERNLDRVTRAESRVGVLTTRARLDEAIATLERTRKLAAIGAVAGKDLTAAESAYKSASAEYEYQSNIALNREVNEARAELETARVDASHIRHEMHALGVENDDHDHDRDSSRVLLRAPVAGVVVERLVNAGAGVEPGRALFTISDDSTVWIVASVPEGRVVGIQPGTAASVRVASLGDDALKARVTFVDPRLDEATRTARVRLEVANVGRALKAGMFADITFSASGGTPTDDDVVVPSAAVQRIGERTVVFVADEGDGLRFEVRDVELGGETDGFRRVISGLSVGEHVATTGSFAIKSRLLAPSLDDGDHH